MILSICGSAGRNGTHTKNSLEIFNKLYQVISSLIEVRSAIEIDKGEKITLVSGGAAFADHIAVKLFLNNPGKYNLHLALPCSITSSGFTGKVGETANYYHKLFREKTGMDSINEILDAINQGASYSVHNGFKDRNTIIANCNFLIASGWGKEVSGGTKDTYNKCQADKVYINLEFLI